MAAPMFRFLRGETLCHVCRACQMALKHTETSVRWSSNRAIIAKTNRKVYARQYPVLLVNPDGSTFRINYKEPRKIIKLPLDINSLTYDERKKRLSQYQVKKKRNVKDDIAGDEDVSNKYKHLWKK